MSTPAVTIAIPAYGHAQFILATLDSVFAQTFTDCEIVVVNDGSPDDTSDVLRPLVEVGRIRYMEQPNAGQAAARNRCLEMARGEFIAYLDDDDLWPADKLAWQVEMLRSMPEIDLLGGSVTRDLVPDQVTAETDERMLVSGIHAFWGCPFTSPGQTLVRTAAMRTVGGFDPAIRGADDYDLYIRLARLKPLLLVRRRSLHYREHAHNASRNRWQMLESCALCLHRRLPEVALRERWAAYRRAYRNLYNYVGRELLIGLRGRAQLLRGVRDGSAKRLVRAFWPGLLVDPKVMRSAVAGFFSSSSVPVAARPRGWEGGPA